MLLTNTYSNLLKGFLAVVMILEISANTEHKTDSNIHLRVIALEYPVVVIINRDKNNNVVSMKGVAFEMLNWLARYNHFSYSILPISTQAMENSSSTLGGLYYLHTNKADLIAVSMIMTSERLIYVDFPHPWMEDVAVIVIPAIIPYLNFGSIWQPFQWPIWSLTFVSTIVVVLAMSFVTNGRVTSFISSETQRSQSNSLTNTFEESGMYVFGLFLSQGGHLKPNRLAVRFLAGVWCLSTFVLVQAYCSTLISFVTTPSSTPLVDSPSDLVRNTHVNIVVLKYRGAEFALMGADTPTLKKLAGRVKSYSNSRCLSITECLRMVASGQHAYIEGYRNILEAIKKDWELTKQCRFSIAKESVASSPVSWGLAKRSSLTESISRGILHMREKGLINKWIDDFQVRPHECQDQMEQRKVKPNSPPRLSLSNLIGAFIILILGYCLSLIVYGCELIYFYAFKK